jgi:hypothetical protein
MCNQYLRAPLPHSPPPDALSLKKKFSSEQIFLSARYLSEPEVFSSQIKLLCKRWKGSFLLLLRVFRLNLTYLALE